MRRFRRPGRWGAAAALSLALTLSGGELLHAAPVSCHCFRDRTFDPSSPAKADPYILATTQNSFFAAAFGIPKRALVQAKMKGVSGDRLWVAYYAGSILRIPPGNLMDSRGKSASWKEALTNRGKPLEPLGRPFLDALEDGADDHALATEAVGEVLRRTLGVNPGELDPLRQRALPTAKIVIAVLAGRWSGREASALVAETESEATTWGSVLHGLGIPPDALEERIGLLVGAARRR